MTATDIFDQIDQESAKSHSFVKIEPGQKGLFRFDKSKISIVEGEYQGKKNKRVCYKVTTPTDANEKDLMLGFMHAKQLNALLKAGLTNIWVERQGSGLATRYTFAPAAIGS